MNPYIIDTFEFSRSGELREGQIKVADLSRLAAVCADASGTVKWSLQSGQDTLGHMRLVLAVLVTVQLICQRCMAPFSLNIESETALILAKNEVEANKIEDNLDDDAVDVIVGSKALDVLALIEDEVLLALPLSARHEVCPDASALDEFKTEKPSPFAVLKDLKR